jgi:DMSO/TMAO reductase YedYZ molybdopterin-dependent catalytic subunit
MKKLEKQREEQAIMKWRHLSWGALLGVVLTAPLVALLYLGDQLADLPFLPFEIFDWVTRILPGPVVTFGIDTMIDVLGLLGLDVADTAKTAEQISAVLQFLVMGVAAGAVFLLVMRTRDLRADSLAGLIMGAMYGLPAIAISLAIGTSSASIPVQIVWLSLLYLAWGLAFAWASRSLSSVVTPAGKQAAGTETPARAQRLNRRQFLIVLGTSAATITVAGAGLGAVLASAERRREQAELEGSMAHEFEEDEGPVFPNSNDPVMPAPGTRPEYTPLKDHYKVFIRSEPTVIEGSTWVLPVTGLVDNPLMLNLEELRSRYERFDQYVTLSCISGRVGTTLISTTRWSGFRISDLLADAQLQPEARYLIITSGDGFYETVSLDLIQSEPRIMLCYDWDGHPIPEEHGFPLRIWIPDRFGMKQPKWITGIEVTDTYEEGYWVERGWDEVAQVKTTSVIDTVAVNAVYESGGRQVVPVGGIAFSGGRGISRVEVRVDGGQWTEAQLRSPLSETTWAIWRYDWPFEAGHHLLEVRCVDGNGDPQIEQASEAHPSGATGIHQREADV